MTQKYRHPLIGFIGQGFVGKHIADDFEARGYATVRYALEKPYSENKEKVQSADIVFIAVPTPSTPSGFDSSVLESVLPLVGRGKTAVIKSTILPGTTEKLQQKHPGITVLFSPEFLLEATAAHDAAFPVMNIVGIPEDSATYRELAQHVLSVMPVSPFNRVCSVRAAEIFKYVHNIHGVWRILFANLMYDLVQAHGADWEEVHEAMNADPYMNAQASYYNRPTHKGGRGAGGHCFIKDLAALREAYENACPGDTHGISIFKHMEGKNIQLLKDSNKDIDLLEGVYGPRIKE